MSIIDGIRFVGEDERKRKYLLPRSVALLGGKVNNADLILKDKPLQIDLFETETTELSNDGNGNAYIVLDYGVELCGGVRLLIYKANGRSPRLRLTFGESLTEALSKVGRKGATNDHAIRQFDIPANRLSDQEWGNTGFRFLKIELLGKDSFVSFKAAPAVFTYRDYKYIGSFKCSDERLNRIFDTAAYTCHLCMQNMLWDGIKRDRLVWIGDMMIESKTALAVFGNVDIVPKSLEFIKDKTPPERNMNNMASYSLWWLMIVNNWYFMTGDAAFLERQHGYIKALCERISLLVAENGEDSLSGYFLDWQTSTDRVSSKSGVRALLKAALSDGEYMLEVLGETQTAEKVHKALLDFEKYPVSVTASKSAAAMLSQFDMIEPEAAAEIILKGGTKGFSTFTAYYIFKALAKAGEYGLALNGLRDYYGAMIDKGATAFFEDYNILWGKNSGRIDELPGKSQKDIHGDFGDHCYKKFRHSLCHGWSSGPVPFIFEEILGIKVTAPGCREITVAPHLCDLEYACGTFPTPFGELRAEFHKAKNGEIISKITAPKEIKVTVIK